MPCFFAQAEIMKLPLALLLLLVPLATAAQCGLVPSSNGMAIVIGKGDKRCFSSPEFREAFRSNLIASVQTMNVEEVHIVRQKRAFDERNARAEKLWQLAERQHAAKGGRYFGQR